MHRQPALEISRYAFGPHSEPLPVRIADEGLLAKSTTEYSTTASSAILTRNLRGDRRVSYRKRKVHLGNCSRQSAVSARRPHRCAVRAFRKKRWHLTRLSSAPRNAGCTTFLVTGCRTRVSMRDIFGRIFSERPLGKDRNREQRTATGQRDANDETTQQRGCRVLAGRTC